MGDLETTVREVINDLEAIASRYTHQHPDNTLRVLILSTTDQFKAANKLRSALERNAEMSNSVLEATCAAIKTHNDAPVTGENLRWVAAHESMSRSWTHDVLIGLADALDGGNS